MALAVTLIIRYQCRQRRGPVPSGRPGMPTMHIGRLLKSFPGIRRTSRTGLLSTTALSRRFEFETLQPRIPMSAGLLPVHGSIDVPGQTARYTFSLTSPTDIYFDSQTPHSNAIN